MFLGFGKPFAAVGCRKIIDDDGLEDNR